MLTWETLTKCVENGCIGEDLRLISQLLIELQCHYSNTDIKELFKRTRERALTNPIEYFQEQIK